MTLTRTEQIFINDDRFSVLCHMAKNLWNEAMYRTRQGFFKGKDIKESIKELTELYNSDNYKAINAQSGQQIFRLVDKSWKAYLKSIKVWKKHPEKYLGKPRIPHYKPKDGEAILIFTNQQCRIQNGHLTFPKNLNIEPVLTRLPDFTDLREVRIIPKGTGYVCEIVHKGRIYNRIYSSVDIDMLINRRWYTRKNNKNRRISIDLGLNNIATIADNIGLPPIVIKGGVLKSINRLYNKCRALLQSVYDKQGIKQGSKMEILTQKRNNRIKDAMHKISRYIVNWCIEHNIGTIIIGHNPEWKQEINLGKKNNQNFVQIPFNKLIEKIQYKAAEAGITVITHEETHTSKCSFLDEEEICHHDEYLGIRIKRGLFISSKGITINADVQGAYNIDRKVVPTDYPKGYSERIAVNGLNPIKVGNIF